MTRSETPAAKLSAAIIATALECGADLAGIAAVSDLQGSPSHRLSRLMSELPDAAIVVQAGHRPGVVQWPDGARSAVVIAVEHAEDEPELDWWVGGGARGSSTGDQLLMAAADRIADRLEQEHGLRCLRIPYQIDLGGVYMKDAAVLAGLGCVGLNNLLLTPELGPRQRLRVLLTEADLPSTGASDYDPCGGCPAPCRTACPRQAFPGSVYTPDEFGIGRLPGRDGAFSRHICDVQMRADEDAAELVSVDGGQAKVPRVHYCRACELACIACAR